MTANCTGSERVQLLLLISADGAIVVDPLLERVTKERPSLPVSDAITALLSDEAIEALCPEIKGRP